MHVSLNSDNSNNTKSFVLPQSLQLRKTKELVHALRGHIELWMHAASVKNTRGALV